MLSFFDCLPEMGRKGLHRCKSFVLRESFLFLTGYCLCCFSVLGCRVIFNGGIMLSVFMFSSWSFVILAVAASVIVAVANAMDLSISEAVFTLFILFIIFILLYARFQ